MELRSHTTLSILVLVLNLTIGSLSTDGFETWTATGRHFKFNATDKEACRKLKVYFTSHLLGEEKGSVD